MVCVNWYSLWIAFHPVAEITVTFFMLSAIKIFLNVISLYSKISKL